MDVVIGIKAHSGWAALVVIGKRDDGFVVVGRNRIELVEEEWQKQPYHAARRSTLDAARDVVTRGAETAQRIATREIRAAVSREQGGGNRVTACALLAGDSMPDWSIEEILAVHFRMHKAEGALFRDALARAAEACGTTLVTLPEKALVLHAERALGTSERAIATTIAVLGKGIGPPWGKDQKDAALAAVVALEARERLDSSSHEEHLARS
jgi:hypothetical protein